MIHKSLNLALKLPGNNTIDPPAGADKYTNLAGFISPLLNIAFYVGMFLVFYFLVWGAFQYMMAGGNKEELAKARSRITWAIVGLMIILLAFSITKFAAEIFPPGIGGLPF